MRIPKLLAVAGVACAALATAPGAGAALGVIKPASFTTNGSLVAGWNWIRASGHTATWTFDVSGVEAFQPRRGVYLNLAPLVTNGVNGGSGHSTTIRLTVSNGTTTTTVRGYLSNPFRPVDPQDSHGIGYQTYGYAYLPSSMWKGVTTLTVKLDATSFRVASRHVAVKKDCLTVAYAK